MLFESLESRQFLSASPVPPQAISDAVVADRLKIRTDLLKFRTDLSAACETLDADIAKVKTDGKGYKNDALKPLIEQYHTDVKAMRDQLTADRLTESSNVLADQSKILADLSQLQKDKGNPSAIKADRAKLLADRIQLQTDELAGLNARISARQSFYTKIFSDISAITTLITSDPNAPAALKTDITTLATDRTNTFNTALTDLQSLATDRQQLITDLTALQTQPV
jgi:hypothetical protein